MSKPVKEMIVRTYRERFADVENAVIIDIRGIEANENNALRLGLQEQQIRVTVLKNSLAAKAFEGTPLEGLGDVLDGPSALAYGGDSVVGVARELVTWAKKVSELDLCGAILDGEVFEGEEGVTRLSKFPTREEAQAKVVQLVLSPAQKLLSAVTSPGSNVAGIIDEIKTRLEDGKAIEKVG